MWEKGLDDVKSIFLIVKAIENDLLSRSNFLLTDNNAKDSLRDDIKVQENISRIHNATLILPS
jgi:hypothetical protein